MEKSSKKRALFCLGTAAYFISYICRLNLTAAMPEMMGSGSFTAAKLGIITSVYFRRMQSRNFFLSRFFARPDFVGVQRHISGDGVGAYLKIVYRLLHGGRAGKKPD